MPTDAARQHPESEAFPPPRLCITAGPTHEPIDAVRYLANRSSGRLGIELTNEARKRGWPVTLLLGPTPLAPPAQRSDERSDTRLSVLRFSSTADLQSLLLEQAPSCDCLIMAAAVADYRPIGVADTASKVRRDEQGLTLTLESTPDLLAMAAERRKPGQLLVGFALEPRESMIEAARAKVDRKKADWIVANPLETMDSETIEAALIERQPPDQPPSEPRRTPGAIPKAEFAGWLLDQIERWWRHAAREGSRTV